MSDELKIELQVESNTTKAELQLNELIDKFKKRKPIELDVRLGNVKLEEFTQSIKTITTNLNSLASLNFSNLDKAEDGLRKISKLVKDFNGLGGTSSTSSTKDKSNSLFDSLGEFVDNEKLERLSKDQQEALAQVKSLQNSARFLKEAIVDYKSSLNEAEKAFKNDNKAIFSDIDSYEKMFDTAVFKRLVKYKKELNEVEKEYRNLGVELADMEKLTNEKYDGTMATRKYQEYVNVLELDADKFKIAVERAKELNRRKSQLAKNLKNNLEKASEDEKAAYKVLETLYKEVPVIDTSKSDAIRNTLTQVLKDDLFRLDFSDLDFRLEDDFKKAYDRFFKLLEEVIDEYNNKFKDVDGFKEIDIFDLEGLGAESEKLEKEVKKTLGVVNNLKGLGEGTLNRLGLDSNSLNVFENLDNSVKNLEDRLNSLKEKFSGAFEISNESSQALQKIKDALLEINKLSEEQKQIFFDFGLDTDKIKKAKKEAEDLKVASESVADVSFDGLIESYSRLESASGQALREIEKIRLSPTRSVTVKYGYEEDEDGLSLERKTQTVEFTDSISKRTKEVISEYTKASKDLMKAQKEYYEAVNGGKSSEETIKKLSENVKVMELNLGNIKKNVTDLEGYPEVMEAVFESFGKLDDIRYRQSETDALKIIDKANLVEANTLLKESKTLIDSISKDSVQLQKDLNAGYKETSDSLEASIRSKEAQLTNNISKLINIPNSKAAIDQIFSYQLAKAQKTEIDIQRIKDKANKTTGTKIVDEQDEYLKSYKRYLTELKAIEKSLSAEKNESARANKILQLDNTFKELDKIKSKLNEVKSKVANELFDKTMRELDLSFASNFSKTYSELDKIEEKINKLSKSNYADKTVVSSVQDTIKGLRDSLNVEFKDLSPKDLSAILVKVEELKKAAKDIDLDIKLSKDSEKIETFIKGVVDQLDILQSMGSDVDISHITRQFKELAAGSDRNSVVMKSINDDVKALEKSLKTAGDTASLTGINFKGFFNDIGDSLRTFTLGEVIGDVITDSLYQTWDIMKEMDSAMANLKKVADISDINTDDKLDSIRSQAIDVAKEVGMASSDVINAIADTLQAGIGSMSESIQVARSAMILANTGDMTQEAASEALNTIINGYNIKPLKEINVEVNGLTTKTTELANAMDLLNHAGNNYAIGTDGVAEAMKRGGTVLSQYGVTLEDSVAMITAANEAIQDPAKVGNALKTISINMAGVKANASKGTLELNKTAKTLKEIAGIDVYSDKSKGQIKGMVEIFDELNEKLKQGKISQDEFLAISEALAGKENAAVLQSLLSNYDTFIQIRGEFAQGLHIGSAEKENAAYVDSLNGKLNKLKEVWIDTLMALADSESVKDLLDLFISVSEGVNKFVKALDENNATLPVMFGLIGGASSYFKTLSHSLGVAEKENVNLTKGFEGFKNTIDRGVVPALKNFLIQGVSIALVTAAIKLGAKVWDDWTNGLKNAEKEIKSSIDNINGAINKDTENLKFLEDTEDRYNELIKKKKELGDTPLDLMSDEQIAEMQELESITYQLAEMFPDLVIGYDEAGRPIMLMAEDMDKLKEKTKEQIEFNQKLLKLERERLAANARDQVKKGEFFGLAASLEEEIKIATNSTNNFYNAIKKSDEDYRNALQSGRETDIKKAQKALEDNKKSYQKAYEERLKLYQEYTAKELEIQQSAFDQIQAINGYDKLNDKASAIVQTFMDNLNWANMDESQYNKWIGGFDKIIKLAGEGSPKVKEWADALELANKKYAATENIDEYNKSLGELAKKISKDLNLDYETVLSGLKNMTAPLDEAERSLNRFLESFGSDRFKLLNGDKLAQQLAEQFNGVSNTVEKMLNNKEFAFKANGALTFNMMSEIANTDEIPDQIQKLANELKKKGVTKAESDMMLEILMSIKSGNKEEIEKTIADVNKKLKDMGMEEHTIDIKTLFDETGTKKAKENLDNLMKGDKKVTREILIDTHGEEKAKQILEAIELLDKRPDVKKAVTAVVEGEEDLVFFAEIIKNLPINKTYTNKFITDNAEALSKLKTYQEVLDYINGLPADIKKKYGISTEGIKQTTEEIEKIEKKIDGTNGKELKVQTKNDDVLKTIEDVEALIKISSEVEKGKYKIEIDANTQQAIDNINLLIDSVNELGKALGNGKEITYKAETAQAAKNISGLMDRIDQINNKNGSTITFNSETAQAAKNITGLIDKVNQIKKLTGKTFKYYATTAEAAKNISGLINRVEQINKLSGKTIKWNAETAQAAKNISGLINKIGDINKRKGTTFKYQSETSQAAKNITGLINKINQANGKKGITVRYNSETAQAAKNITGLINKINEINKKSGKTFTWYANTAQAAKNITGLINRIDQINGKKSKSFTYTTTVKQKTVAETDTSVAIPDTVSSSVSPVSAVADEIAAQTSNIQASLRTGIGEITSFSSAMTRATNHTNIDNTYKNTIDSFKYNIELLKELENRIDMVKNSLSSLGEEYKNAVGDKKLDYLKRQNELYKEQFTLVDDLYYKLYDQRSKLWWELEHMGFEFTDDWNISNYEEKMLEMQRKVESLKAKAESASEASSNYKGEDESTKEYLKSVYEAAKKEYDNYNEYLNSCKDLTNSYFDIHLNKLPEANDEWYALNNAIKETSDSIEELHRQQRLFANQSSIKSLNYQYDKISDQLELIDIGIENAYGSDKINLIEEKVNLLKQQSEAQKAIIEQYKAMTNIYREDLSKYGFNFDSMGDVTNIEEVLNSYKDHEDLEKVNNLLEEYIDLQRDELPDAFKELQNINSIIKDAYREQLNITKDIEEKITQVYKKQIEERIKLLNKETDAKLDALNKQKNAYNDYRDEVDYNNDYNDKLDNVLDIQKQLDIAMKDNSLSGQKRVRELQKQLASAQKELEKLTQDRIDKNVNDMFDEEADRIEEENKLAIEKLEQQWSDSKIAEMVAQALGSGIFTDIEGNVHSLEDVLIDFASETGELFGVLGDTIRNELITNLDIAKDTMLNLRDILNELDLNSLSRQVVTASMPRAADTRGYNESNNYNSVAFNSPLMVIEGSVTSDVMPELEAAMRKMEKNITNNIVRHMRT